MLLLRESRDGECGDVGNIDIEVINELAPFIYIPSHTWKIFNINRHFNIKEH